MHRKSSRIKRKPNEMDRNEKICKIFHLKSKSTNRQGKVTINLIATNGLNCKRDKRGEKERRRDGETGRERKY